MSFEIKLSPHARKRLYERTHFKGNKKEADSYIKNAFRNGMHITDLEYNERIRIRHMIKNNYGHNAEQEHALRRTTIYKDGVFLFNRFNVCMTILKNPLKRY